MCRGKIALRLAALLVVCLCPLLLFGQASPQGGQTGRTIHTPLQINITGCLKKNAATGGYSISDENGRTWELSSKKVNLAEQVFHTVSVSGHPMSGMSEPEGKSEASQKSQAGQPQLSLDVVELTMVSNSCTR